MNKKMGFSVAIVTLAVGIFAPMLVSKQRSDRADTLSAAESTATAASTTTADAPPASGHGNIGFYGHQQLTVGELTPEEKLKLYEAEKQVYNAYDEILVQRYMANYFEQYAKSKSLKSTQEAQDHYFKKEIKVSNEEVKNFLIQNKDNPGLQKIPEAERTQRIREYLESQAKSGVLRKLVQSARDRGEIRNLYPKPVEPRLNVTDGHGYATGPSTAKVTIVEFADYQCPYCARMVPPLKDLVKTYNGKVRWVYRDFPLLQMHPEALPSAIAAKCAGAQGKYFEMHDLLFENHQNLSKDMYTQTASKMKLDMGKFTACQKDPKTQEAVLADMEDGNKLGVNGTPAYFVNGRKLTGGLDKEEFAKIIDEEL